MVVKGAPLSLFYSLHHIGFLACGLSGSALMQAHQKMKIYFEELRLKVFHENNI